MIAGAEVLSLPHSLRAYMKNEIRADPILEIERKIGIKCPSQEHNSKPDLELELTSRRDLKVNSEP